MPRLLAWRRCCSSMTSCALQKGRFARQPSARQLVMPRVMLLVVMPVMLVMAMLTAMLVMLVVMQHRRRHQRRHCRSGSRLFEIELTRCGHNGRRL